MAGYQGLGRITDPATQAVCKALFDLTSQLQRRLTTLEGTALQQGSAYDARGERLTNLAAPVVGSDAVTLSALRDYVGAQLALSRVGLAAAGALSGGTAATPLAVAVDGTTIQIVNNQLTGGLLEQTTAVTGTQNNFNVLSRFTALRATGASLATFTGFTVNGAAPRSGDRILLMAEGAGNAKVTDEDSGSSAAHRIDCPSVNGQIVGPHGHMLLVYDGTDLRWHAILLDPGAPITVPYNSGDFTGSGSMTWTVESADLKTFTYIQLGKLVKVAIVIEDSSVGGTPAGTLSIALPAGFVAAKTTLFPAFIKDNGSFDSGAGSTGSGASTISTFTRTIVAWQASVNATNVYHDASIEVN